MPRRRALVLLLLAASVSVVGAAAPPVVAAPTMPAPNTPTPPLQGGGDEPTQGTGWFEELGGTSPFCERKGYGEIGAEARKSCRRTGAITNGYPSDNYGLDNNVDTGINPTSWIASTLQWLISVIWLGLVYLVKGVLVLLEWAFTTDIYEASEQESAKDVALMYTVVGKPWMTFALAVCGLWGLWNGLVRRRAIETLGGLAMTVGLMLVALVIISRPEATVGHLSKITNQAAISALGAASSATVDAPATTLATSTRQLFDTVVLRPWCALQFGDVTYCVADHGGTSVADVWLSFTPNSKPRKLLYKRTKEGDSGGSWTGDLKGAIQEGWKHLKGKSKEERAEEARVKQLQQLMSGKAGAVIQQAPKRVELQGAGGTMQRFAVLLVVGIGVAGAVALIGAIAIRLIIHGGLMTLVLLLLAPLAMLAPAFGEAGRRAFLTWARKLIAAVVTKFVFAVLLAVVMLVTNILSGLQDALGGWLPCWLVLSAFWWSLFLRRAELLAMVGMEGGRPTNGLSQLYHLTQMGRDVRRTAMGATRPIRAVARPLRRNSFGYRRGEEELARQHAHGRARERARAVHQRDFADAQRRLEGASDDRARKADLRRRLSQLDRQIESRTAGGQRLDDAQVSGRRAERDRLHGLERDVERRLSSPELAQAHAVVRRGPDGDMDDKQLQRWLQRRQRELQRGWDDDANLRAAGIDVEAHREAAGNLSDPAAVTRVAEDRRLAESQMRRDRALVGRALDDGTPMRWSERRSRMRDVQRDRGRRETHRALREQVDSERRRIRDERRRARVYR